MMNPRVVHNGAKPEYYFEERCHITECWNSADDPAASIARARVAPGVTTRLHRLRGVTERYVMLQGTGRLVVGDRAPENVGPGDVVVIPPETGQRITNTGGTDLVFLTICTPRFRPDLYEDLETGDRAD